MVMKHTVLMTIRGAIPDKVSVQSSPAEIADRFIKLDKAETSTHLSKLINMLYNDKGN